MRVLSIMPGPDTGSNMIFTRRQIAALQRIGIEFQTYYIESRTSIPAMYRAVREVRKIIRSFSPDIVHSNYGTMTSFLSMVSLAFIKIPLIITFHGSDINRTVSDGLARDFFGRLFSNLSVLKATSLICVSAGVKNNLWWRKNIAEIFPCGINMYEFRPMGKNEMRLRLGWNTDEKVVLFNANNPRIKRLDIAEKTIELVRKKWPTARLQVIQNIDPGEIPVYLNASDCLLICSDSEGSPMIVKEALACNLPVVGVDVGDVAEVLKDVACSYLAEKNPEALADAINFLFLCRNEPNGRTRLAEKKFTEDEVASSILNLYNKVIKQ